MRLKADLADMEGLKMMYSGLKSITFGRDIKQNNFLHFEDSVLSCWDLTLEGWHNQIKYLIQLQQKSALNVDVERNRDPHFTEIMNKRVVLKPCIICDLV